MLIPFLSIVILYSNIYLVFNHFSIIFNNFRFLTFIIHWIIHWNINRFWKFRFNWVSRIHIFKSYFFIILSNMPEILLHHSTFASCLHYITFTLCTKHDLESISTTILSHLIQRHLLHTRPPTTDLRPHTEQRTPPTYQLHSH